MAEISSLLGLITDEHTREVLIAKMEHMFDAAEDEQKLINDIGSPTKVAVALIRYADNGVVTPEAAVVIDSVADDELEQEEEFETIEALSEQPELLIPETDETEPTAEEASEPAEAAAEAAEEAPAAAEEAAEAVEEKAEAAPAAAEEELDLLEVLTGAAEEAPAVEADKSVDEPAAEEQAAPEVGGFSEAGDLASDEAEAIEEEAREQIREPETDTSAEAEATEAEAEEAQPEAPEQTPAPEAEAALSDADSDVETLEESAADAVDVPEDFEKDAPLTITKVNTFLAILYFIIPGLVIGLPVFLVLVVLNLAFLLVAAAVITAAVLLVLTGLTPLGLPDKLLCFGGAAAAAAIGLVLLWFTIWFLLCVTCGWVRLMTRGGKAISRKEVEIV